MARMFLLAIVFMAISVVGVQSKLHKKKDKDLICAACLKTMSKIDSVFTSAAGEHKSKKSKERKAAVQELLGGLCDNDDFKNVEITGSKPYRQFTAIPPPIDRKLEDEDKAEGDNAETSEDQGKNDEQKETEGEEKDTETTKEVEETEAGADLRKICEGIVTDYTKKMRPHLSDFRRASRSSLSTDVCYKWAKHCEIPKPAKKLKQKLTKSEKCLISAYSAAQAKKWGTASKKIECANQPDPEPKEENEEKEEKQENGENKEDKPEDKSETKKDEESKDSSEESSSEEKKTTKKKKKKMKQKKKKAKSKKSKK